jgi:hypothetical protein
MRPRDFPEVIADGATKTVTFQRTPVMFMVRVLWSTTLGRLEHIAPEGHM